MGYETKLSTSSFPGRSRGAHFQEANSNLLKAMDGDEAFAMSMNDMIPGIRDQLVGPRGGVSRGGPRLWTWHHAQEPGVMQLVPTAQHTPPGALHGLLHPGGRGGMAIWG